ncbi:MAG: prepilin peptidase [Candidatus Hermodarchaeota archaeon]
MEIILGSITVILMFFVLLFASIKDVQTNIVTNWVWIIGLFGMPIAIFRMFVADFLLPYGLQTLLIFILVIVGFRIGIIGGADGKAILLISLTYPWTTLDFVWLLLAPLFILLGGFLLIGVYSLVVLIQNLITRKQITSSHSEDFKPEKKMFWITRRLERTPTTPDFIAWKPVVVPLILYFFVSYLVLLILVSGPIFIPS